MENVPPGITIFEMFNRLIGSGMGRNEAGDNLIRAISLRAIALIDTNDYPWPQEKLISESQRVITMIVRAEPASASDVGVSHLKRVGLFDMRSAIEEPKAPALKQAPGSVIRAAIEQAYEAAQARGSKPPNINELPAAVLRLLAERGFQASGALIKKLGDEFKGRRRPSGRRLKT